MEMYVKSFKRLSDGVIFTAETGDDNWSDGNGHYMSGEEALCNTEYIIWAIHDDNDKILTVGDLINNSATQITGFKYKLNDVMCIINHPEPHNTIRFVNAEKYIEPVLETPRTTRRTRARANTTPEPTINNPFNEIEQVILSKNTRPFRLERLLKRRTETLQEFLERFFEQWNKDRDTIFVDDESVQTEMDKRRSLGDIYMISKYYYPNCTLNEVLNLLYNVLPESMPEGFRTSYCFTINKRVWYFDDEEETGQFDKTQSDEFGKQYNFYLNNIQ